MSIYHPQCEQYVPAALWAGHEAKCAKAQEAAQAKRVLCHICGEPHTGKTLYAGHRTREAYKACYETWKRALVGAMEKQGLTNPS